MNNREEAKEKIIDFLNDTSRRTALITGTHQHEKHKLVMRIIDNHYKSNKILFRTNVMYNLQNEDFVGFAGISQAPTSGKMYLIGNNYYYFDSVISSTWRRHPKEISFAILYPFGVFTDNRSINAIKDVLRSDVEKVFIISCMDYSDSSQISEYYDYNIIFDAEEEDKEYHKNILFQIEQFRKKCR